jgi:hypothetical protein
MMPFCDSNVEPSGFNPRDAADERMSGKKGKGTDVHKG